MLKGFIVGTGRSGTTLLVNLLGSHPRLSPLYELEFLLNILSWFQNDGAVVPKELLGLLYTWGSAAGDLPFKDVWSKEYDPVRPKHGSKYALFSKVELMQAGTEFLDALKTIPADQAFARFIRTLSDRHAENDGKPHCIIKTPALMNAPDAVFTALPEAKMIHIFRDGRDVWCSIKNFWWGPKTLEESATWWMKHMRVADAIRNKYPDNFLEIRYETFLEKPTEQLKTLFRFLDMEPEDIDFNPSSKSVGRFRNELSPQELDAFHEIAGDALEERGYLSIYRDR